MLWQLHLRPARGFTRAPQKSKPFFGKDIDKARKEKREKKEKRKDGRCSHSSVLMVKCTFKNFTLMF